MEKVIAKIFRFDPSMDEKPRYDTYEVPYEKDMRILDVLIAVGDDLGKGIAHRWYCGVKRCGACSATVNGKPVAVCWEPAEENMIIEPLPNFPIIRDLVVDRQGYDKVVSSFRKFLVRREKPRKFPEDIRHEEMIHVYNLVQCTECLLCTSVCPDVDINYKEFAGPMALVQLAKHALDPRDTLDRIEETVSMGVHNCVSCYACVDICPSDINPLERAIYPLRQKLLKARKGLEAKHLTLFEEMVKEDGMITPAKLFLKDKGLAALLKLPFAIKMGLKGKIPTKLGADVPEIQNIRDLIKYMEEKDA